MEYSITKILISYGFDEIDMASYRNKYVFIIKHINLLPYNSKPPTYSHVIATLLGECSTIYSGDILNWSYKHYLYKTSRSKLTPQDALKIRIDYLIYIITKRRVN